jgi:two-component system, NarL family, response regulator NreC
MSKLRILVADDHAILREGLALLIGAQSDMQVIAQARGGREAVSLAREHLPDLVLLDVSMPDLRGAEAAERIRVTCPSVRILALTRHADQGYLRRMLRAGASGYVLKKTAGDALIDAIRIVATGGAYVDPSLAGSLVARLLGTGDVELQSPNARRAVLTEREQQVLKLIAWGQSNKEAAAQLGISVKTVESYKASALEKLELRGRTDIVRYALSQRWLSDDEGPE